MGFYPDALSHEATDRIEAEKIRAYRTMLPVKRYGISAEDERLIIQFLLHMFLVFVREACSTPRGPGWTIVDIRRETADFLQSLISDVFTNRLINCRSPWMKDPYLRMPLFRSSGEWKEYEDLLLVFAVNPAAPCRVNKIQKLSSSSLANKMGSLRERQLGIPSKKRSIIKIVKMLARELRTIKPLIYTEGHYDVARRKYPKLLVFKIAERDGDVKSWIENVQQRNDLTKLAKEITARHFRVTDSTVDTYWSHKQEESKN